MHDLLGLLPFILAAQPAPVYISMLNDCEAVGGGGGLLWTLVLGNTLGGLWEGEGRLMKGMGEMVRRGSRLLWIVRLGEMRRMCLMLVMMVDEP